MNSRSTAGVAVAETLSGSAVADAVNPNERIRIANPPHRHVHDHRDRSLRPAGHTGLCTGRERADLSPGARTSRLARHGSVMRRAPDDLERHRRADQLEHRGRPLLDQRADHGDGHGHGPVRYIDSYNVGAGGFPGPE